MGNKECMAYANIKNLYANIKNKYFDENHNLIIQLQLILALIGGIVLIAGVFCPFIKAPFLGVVDYTRIGKYYDEIVVACGVLTIILALIKLYRWLLIPAIVSLTVIIFSIYNVYAKVEMLRNRIEERLYNNPYKDLLTTFVDTVKETVSFQWGIIILATGIVLLITGALLKNTDIVIPVKTNSKKSDM